LAKVDLIAGLNLGQIGVQLTQLGGFFGSWATFGPWAIFSNPDCGSYLRYVVDDRKYNRDWQQILLDSEVLQGVHDGEVALKRHGHRHVNRPSPGNVYGPVAKWN